jgi:hypothetical protein
MYNIINKYSEFIINSFDFEKEIHPYLKIQEYVACGQNNEEFQKLFETYYGMKPFYSYTEFCVPFFNLMNGNNSLKYILNSLYEINKKVNFSFATKLIHTVNTTMPIYDSLVGKLFYIDEIKPLKNETEIQLCLRKYNFLFNEYNRIISNGLICNATVLFNNAYNHNNIISQMRVIDFILWKYAKLLKDGAILNGQIEYS